MSERYSKLYSLPKNLYAEGAPVIVSAGNLLKDNQTEKVLAQLKIKNISNKTIKAAKVLVHAQDTTGKAIDGDAEQEYLDLSVEQGEEFGQKVAIALPNASTRGFSVEVKQVVFTDNSTWEAAGIAWEPLPVGESLIHWLGDIELVKQYQLHFGGKCDSVPQEHKDLWRCTCGEWNKGNKCNYCGKAKTAQLAIRVETLKADRDARLAKEKAEYEAKEAANKEEAEKRAKKAKKTLSIVLPLFIVSIVAFLLLTKVLIPNSNYGRAKALIDAGQYEEAIAAFEALGEFKDSPEQIVAARDAMAEAERLAKEAQIEVENAAAYAEAEELLTNGKYAESYRGFLALGNYKDSASRAEIIKAEHYAEIISVGDIITFGSYEQDNNTSNGKEDIEWIVLYKENNRVLVVSKNVLDYYEYNESTTSVTWEGCTLRKWLNDTFLKAAFSSSEQKKIPTVTVRAEKNPKYSTSCGSDTKDKVFLLSITEVNTSFSDDSSAGAKVTTYAKGRAESMYKYTDFGYTDWWLRTQGESSRRAARVSSGEADNNGAEVGMQWGVRPAIWIDLG